MMVRHISCESIGFCVFQVIEVLICSYFLLFKWVIWEPICWVTGQWRISIVFFSSLGRCAEYFQLPFFSLVRKNILCRIFRRIFFGEKTHWAEILSRPFSLGWITQEHNCIHFLKNAVTDHTDIHRGARCPQPTSLLWAKESPCDGAYSLNNTASLWCSCRGSFKDWRFNHAECVGGVMAVLFYCSMLLLNVWWLVKRAHCMVRAWAKHPGSSFWSCWRKLLSCHP